MEKILIADDSQMSRTITKMALEEKGYSVVEAEDGLTVLDLVQVNRPDLILLDVLMPNRNGFEVCKILKSNPEFKTIPIIFVTGLEEMTAKKEGFDIGADDYITKPYIIDELLLRVELMLRIKRERDSIYTRIKEIETQDFQLTQEQTHLIQKEKELLLRQIYVSLHHEIRNPLTTILIGAQVLNSLCLKDTEKKIVNEVLIGAKRIRNIMDSLGSMKEKDILIDEYVNGTTMVKLKKDDVN